MSLNSTPSAERIHIGIFGRRNAGKSSLINALTNQNIAIVSDIKGTTTDPVIKAMELLPLGPVVIIDTPGLDDDGQLGELRIQKAYQSLNKTDIAILVVDASAGMSPEDYAILERIEAKKLPYIIVMNKCDLPDALTPDSPKAMLPKGKTVLFASAASNINIEKLKESIAHLAPKDNEQRKIVSDLISPSDLILLVVPIDKSAPKGRLILPQQQTIRDILDLGAVAIVTRENELADTLKVLGKKPALVITDSQVFAQVSAIIPRDIPLTSFSILFARYKGNLETVTKGAAAINTLEDGDTVLISEGCTHHRQCEDIGTVKLPKLIQKYTGKQIHFEFTSGTEFPLNVDKYKMIVHCGGCTLNEREMKFRLQCAEDAGVPMTNYGTAIAYMQGILERSVEIFS